MKSYQSIKFSKPTESTPKNWDVIVIGSGMGGLAAASSLSRYGKKVLLLEQHYVIGGFSHVFTRKEFEWDVGVHAIGELGKGMQLRRMFDWVTHDQVDYESFGDVYETFHFPNGEVYEFPNTKEKFRAALKGWFPNEGKAIDLYFEKVAEAVKSFLLFYPTRTFSKGLTKTIEKTIGRSGVQWRSKTTKQVLDEIGASEKLIMILTTQWGYYGDSPENSCFALHASCVNHFFTGAWFPIGGASQFAETIVAKLREKGSDALVRAPVEEVLIKNNKAYGVKLKDGIEFFAKKIISCTGAKTSLKFIKEKSTETQKWMDEINSFKSTPAHFCLYMGFKGDIKKAGATTSSQWVFETWNPESIHWNIQKENHSPALFISFPSIKNPKHVAGPEQLHTGEIVTFSAMKDFEKWSDSRRGNRPKDYAEFKKDLEERLFAQFKLHFPKLAELVVYKELSTPLSTAFFNPGANQGAMYGLEHTPKRFLSSALNTRTPVSKFYMGGCDVASCGVAGGFVGGMLAAATLEPRVFRHML